MDHPHGRDPDGTISDAMFARQVTPMVEQTIPAGHDTARGAVLTEHVTSSQSINGRGVPFVHNEDGKDVDQEDHRGLIVTVKRTGGSELRFARETVRPDMTAGRQRMEITLKGEQDDVEA